MGCDIHTFVEVKHNGKWLLYNQPRVDRDYRLFEKMAGVRGDIEEALCAPKGLPSDLSESVAMIYDYEKPDAHSESYLTLIEINRLQKWYDENYDKSFGFYNNFGFLFGNGYDDLAELADPPPIEDVRFVIWFDN